MPAEFTGKVVKAYYISEGHKDIEVIFDTDGQGKYARFLVQVDEDDYYYKALQEEGWDLDKIAEDTAEYKRAESERFGIIVNKAAEQLAREMLGMQTLNEEKQRLLREAEELQKHREDLKKSVDKIAKDVDAKEADLRGLDQTIKVQTNQADSIVFSYILEKNNDKEELFKMKLWALELDVVKDADKEIKSKIRKTTTMTGVFGILDTLME